MRWLTVRPTEERWARIAWREGGDRGRSPGARLSMRNALRWLRPGHLGTEAELATFRTLHSASRTAPELREGLTTGSAERAIRHLRDLLGVPAVERPRGSGAHGLALLDPEYHI